MDPTALTLIVGAALVTIPSWLAWAAGKRAGLRAAGLPPALTCSCGHGYGAHEDGQRCHAVTEGRRNYEDVLDPCPCRAYDGPEPLPKVWTPPTLP